MNAPANARDFVISVLRETLPTAQISDDTKLTDLGFDKPALAALAARINARHWHGVHVDTGAIQQCQDVACVISLVKAKQQ